MNWRQVRMWATIGMVLAVMGAGLALFGRRDAQGVGTFVTMVGVGTVTFVKHTRRED